MAKFAKATEVCDRYRISITTLYAEVKKDRLPPPLRIGNNSRWSVAQLDEFDASLLPGVDSRRTAAANSTRRKAAA